MDLGADRHGSLYVLELVKQSWLQWELGLVDPPVGGLFRIRKRGRSPQELVPDQLVLPGGVAVAKHGAVYVTGPIFGPPEGSPGVLARVR